VDISGTGFQAIRYVRVVDLTDGDFNDPSSGYDLDAVVNLSVGDGYKTNEDAGVPLDTDSEQDAGDIIGGGAGGCGCAAAGAEEPSGAMRLLSSLFIEL
jgi:hypothetical protein